MCLGKFYYEKNSHYSTTSVLLHQSKWVKWLMKLATSLRGHIAYLQELKIFLFTLSLLGAVEWSRILFTKYSCSCNKLEDFSINTWSLRIKDEVKQHCSAQWTIWWTLGLSINHESTSSSRKFHFKPLTEKKKGWEKTHKIGIFIFYKNRSIK